MSLTVHDLLTKQRTAISPALRRDNFPQGTGFTNLGDLIHTCNRVSTVQIHIESDTLFNFEKSIAWLDKPSKDLLYENLDLVHGLMQYGESITAKNEKEIMRLIIKRVYTANVYFKHCGLPHHYVADNKRKRKVKDALLYLLRHNDKLTGR